MTLQNAIEWIRVNKLPYWRLEHRNKKVAESQEDESKELDVEESVSHLENMVDLLGAGRYTLKGRKKKQGNAGELHFNFTAEEEIAGPAIAGPGAWQQDSQKIIDLNRRITELEFQLQKKEIEYQMESLRTEVKELKGGGNNDRWSFFGDAVGRVMVDYMSTGKMPAFMQGSAAAAVAAPSISGTAGTTITGDTADEQRIEKALERLHLVAGEKLVESLEALASYAEANPGQFKGFMDMLISQNN